MDDVAERLDQRHVFDRAIELAVGDAPATSGAHVLRGVLIKDLWVADRGPWGGYLAALIVRALEVVLPDTPLLSLSLHFMRRMQAGPVDVVVEVVKAGRRATHTAVRLVQGDTTGVMAMATLGQNPADDFVSDLIRPDAPPASDVPRRAESTHNYMQHIDVRPITKVRPWTGDQMSSMQGWISLVEPRPLDTPLLAAVTDAWMPVMWGRLSQPAGKVTVEMTLYFRSAITPGDMGWWFVRQTTQHIERGFAEEDGEVWGSDGRLLVQSRQLVLLAR